MDFDFDSLKAKARELTNTGVAKAKELTSTGMVKAKELTNTGMAKAKELTEIGKLKVQNVSEQDEIRKAYMAIGKLYFERNGEAPDECYAEYCAKIVASQDKIAYNNERIADIKAAGNLSDEDLLDVTPVAEDEDTPEV